MASRPHDRPSHGGEHADGRTSPVYYVVSSLVTATSETANIPLTEDHRSIGREASRVHAVHVHGRPRAAKRYTKQQTYNIAFPFTSFFMIAKRKACSTSFESVLLLDDDRDPSARLIRSWR